MRPSDLQKVIRLCGEVGQMSTPEQRIEHFLSGTMRLTGTDILGMVAMSQVGEHYQIGTGYIMGADESRVELLEEWYGSQWYACPQNHVMASIRDMNQRKIGLIARREGGSPAYSMRDRDTLDCVSHCFGWLFSSLEEDQYFGTAPVDLPDRLEPILNLLLRGLSEKEIAEEVCLSPRTVHKYVQKLYRHFGVKSRSKLMALWTRFPNRGALPRVQVHYHETRSV